VVRRVGKPTLAHSAEIDRWFRSNPATYSDESRPVIPTNPAGVADRTASE
jgi:hypothetical protein